MDKILSTKEILDLANELFDTKGEIAEYLGISRTALNHYENERRKFPFSMKVKLLDELKRRAKFVEME